MANEPRTVAEAGVKVVVTGKKEATKEMQQLVSQMSDKPIDVKVDLDFKGIEDAIKNIQAIVNKLGSSFDNNFKFSGFQKSLDDSIKKFKDFRSQVKDNGKDVNAIRVNLVGLKEITDGLSRIEQAFGTLGENIDFKGFERLETSLTTISNSIHDIVIGMNFDNLRPSPQIQKDIDEVNNKIQGLTESEKEYNEIQEKLYSSKTWKRNAKDSISSGSTESMGISKKMISYLERFVELGGDLSKIKLPKDALGEIHTYQDLFVLLQKEGQINLDTSKITNAIQEVTELRTKLEGLNHDLEEATARENRNIQASLDEKTIKALQGLAKIEKLEIGDNATIGFNKEDIEAILTALGEITTAVNSISTLLTSDQIELKVRNIGNAFEEASNGINTVTESMQKVDTEIDETTTESGSNIQNLESKVENLSDSLNKKNTIRIFDGIKEYIYDVEKDFDSLMEKLSEMAEKMSIPVFHGGVLNKETLNADDYRPGESLRNQIERHAGGAIGTGTYFTSDLEDVLGWIKNHLDDGKNRELYAVDLNKYLKGLYTVSGDDESGQLIDFFRDLSRFVNSSSSFDNDGRSKTDLEKSIKNEATTENFYNHYKNLFEKLKINFSDFVSWFNEEVSRLNTFDNSEESYKRAEKVDNTSSSFQKNFLKNNGINVNNGLYDDSTGVGSVVFDIDKEHPYDISFGNNQDIAKIFYNKVIEKILANKASNPEYYIDDIIDKYHLDDAKEIDDESLRLDYGLTQEETNALVERLKLIHENASSAKDALDDLKKKTDSVDSSTNNSSKDGSTDKVKSPISSPSQKFDNEVQQNLVMLENYENTIKEIDKLKMEPETGEAKKKIEELIELSKYYASQITILRSENGGYIQAKSGILSGLEPGYAKYSSDQRKRFYDVAKSNSDLQISSVKSEFSGIASEIDNIESKSNNLKASLTTTFTESEKYVKSLKSALTSFAIENTGDWKPDKEVFDEYLEKFPELEKFKDFSISPRTDEFKAFINGEWLDFLSTLPKAEEYLKSIGYEKEQLSSAPANETADLSATEKQIENQKELTDATEKAVEATKELHQEQKEEPQSSSTTSDKLTESLETERAKVDEVVESEKSKFDELKSKLDDTIPKAINEKNEAFTKEQEHVHDVVEVEKGYLDELKGKIQEVSDNANIDLNINNASSTSTQSDGVVNEADSQTKRKYKKKAVKDDDVSKNEELANKRAEAVERVGRETTAAIEKADNSVIQAATNFYDSQNRLVKMQIKSIENTEEGLRQVTTTINFDSKQNEAFASDIYSWKFDTSEITKVEDALETLISTEERYQKITTKQDVGLKLSPAEVGNLESINIQREKANKILEENGELTEAQQKIEARWIEKQEEAKRVAEAQTIALMEQAEAAEKSQKASERETKSNGSNVSKSDIGKGYVQDIKKAEQEAYDIQDALKNTENLMSEIGKKTNFSKSFNDADEAVKKLNEDLKAGNISIDQYNSKVSKQTKGVFADTYDNGLQKQITKFTSDFGKTFNFDKMMPEFANKVMDARRELDKCHETIESIQKGEFVDDGDLQKLKQALSTMESMSAKSKGAENVLANDNTIAKLLSNLKKYKNDYSGMSSELKSEIQGIIDSLERMDNISKKTAKDFGTSFENIKGTARETGQEVQSFSDGLLNRVKSMNQSFIGMYLSLWDIVRYGREMFETVNQLDTAMVDLKKTTAMNNDELDDFYKNSNNIAEKMGVSTEEIINQASAWSRLGFNTKDQAETMAKVSSQFASISPDMDVDTATDGLVSVMKAFDIDPDDTLDGIGSKINKIGNTAATTNGEVVDMLQRSSSAMKEANNTLDETIALETGAVEITRNAESTGTAFKTLSMRLRGYDEETESYTGNVEELTGKIADLTKTAKTPGGISLFTDANKTEFKSTFQLFKEIAAIYDDLDDKTQAKLLEAMAGKRNGQVVGAVLSNWDSVEKAMKNLQDSAGSADQEMAIIEDSIDFKLNAIKQTWTGVLQNLADDSTVKTILDVLTKLSKGLGSIIKDLGVLGTLAVGGGAFAAFKNIGRNKNAVPQFV